VDKRIGLAACGAIVALMAAGCGTSSTSGNSTATGGPGATAAPSPSPSSTQPSWVKSLGPGVTVTGSSRATAGDGSPAGVFLTEVKDVESGHFADICSLLKPSQQATCKSELGSIPAAELKADMPTFKNLATTYTAIDGDKALVGSTGSMCDPNAKSKCTTNTDPAAIFDSGKSFATLWNQTVNSKNNSYTLIPLIKVNGAWYGYSSSF
jgi:hypothetical protein